MGHTALELAELETRTLFVLDKAGCLVAVNDIGRPAAPWVFVNRTPEGCVLRFRAGAPAALRSTVELFVSGLPPFCSEGGDDGAAGPLAAAVAQQVAIERWTSGPAFVIPASGVAAVGAMQLYPAHAALLHPDLAPWGPELQERRPCFAVFRDGRAAAICASARSTAEAAEAGVETATEYRGQGAAVLSTMAWAAAVQASGRTAFYSTAWTNEASRAVARKLEGELFAENISVY